MADDPGPRAPRRPVTAEEAATFRADGVVRLPGVLPEVWVDRMRAAVERLAGGDALADMSAMASGLDRLAPGGEALTDADVVDALGDRPRGRFAAGTDHWRTDTDFRAFATASPLPALVAPLLGSSTVRLWEDSVLVKEPGTVEPTAWHQDLGYFHVEGEQVCTTWCPLDPVTPETGAVRYVRGSHRWGVVYRPNLFVSAESLPGTRGEVVPDLDGRVDVEVVTFALEPGDVVVHHSRTLHGAPGNRSATIRRRAVSVRYCGDDARHHLRPGAPGKPHHAHVRDGDPLTDPDTPLVFP